jgi:hypothetical protein
MKRPVHDVGQHLAIHSIIKIFMQLALLQHSVHHTEAAHLIIIDLGVQYLLCLLKGKEQTLYRQMTKLPNCKNKGRDVVLRP